MATRRKGFDVDGDVPKSLQDQPFYGLRLDAEQMAFAEAILSPDIDIVFCNSKAGSGKTTIATGAANMLVQHGQYNEIIYIMSPYGERKQGWLPGTITEKSSVYFEAFYQALINCNINLELITEKFIISGSAFLCKFGIEFFHCSVCTIAPKNFNSIFTGNNFCIRITS